MSRFLFISSMDGVAWGGSELLWSGAAMRLRQDGHTVSVAVIQWPTPAQALRDLESAGCKIYWRERGPNFSLGRRAVDRLRRSAGQLPQRDAAMDDCIREAKPDLVVISQGYWTDGADWMAACQRTNAPYAVIAQAVGECYWPDDAVADRLRNLYTNAVRAYFVSQANLELASHQMAANLDNAEVVRNPFNVPWDSSPPWPADHQTMRLACIARLQGGIKGHDILFDVLRSEKWKSRPLEVSLYGDGSFGGSLRKLKDLYGLDRVTFQGFAAGVDKIWSEHHALILPSRMEGLPLVVVEAMLCGRPCIVTDIAGNAELIADNVTGFVASAANAKQLDEAMERAWNRRDEWPSIGKLAAERVREQIPRDPAATFAERLLSALK